MSKRAFDLIFATCALLATWPLIVIGAIATKLTSPGPVFYRAKRCGHGGVTFEMFKLRTMRVGCYLPERRITEDNDDRITPVGQVLRRFRIDELPQFWNVLRGDMSVIGPRPEDWEIVQRYYTADQRRVLTIRPGIASPADVRWYPDFTYHDPPPIGIALQDYYIQRHLPAKLAEELRYVEHHSLLVDMKVIALTIYCVLIRSWLLPKQCSLIAEPHQSKS